MSVAPHERHGGRQVFEAQLGQILSDAAAGRFPPADGGVTLLRQPSERDAGVIAFTAHAVIFTDADHDWVRGQLPPGELAGPVSATFLHALATATDRKAGSLDLLCTAQSLDGPPPIELIPERESTHSRMLRALNYRDEVRAWRADGGIVLLGRGVAGRLETAIEVNETRRGQGLGRRLALAARHLVPPETTLWAQVAPGNAASVRAFFAAGFVPVGAEILLAAAGDHDFALERSQCDDVNMSDASRVTDDQRTSRFQIMIDGMIAELDYRRRADRLVLIHTEVPEALGGHGLGGELVQAAVDRAAKEHLTLVPLCPFARSWLERNPEATDKVNVDWGAPPED